MFRIFIATYSAVFVAEVAGDKLLFTTSILTTRYRMTPVLYGMIGAFLLKMGVAVIVGREISLLPAPVVAAITAASFLGVAYTLWRNSEAALEIDERHSSRQAALISFASIFFAEWGDIGQVTAATMAARFGVPWVVWLGAVAAMATKGALAAAIGARTRQWVQQQISLRTLRYSGVTLLLLLGIISMWETLERLK